MLNGVEQVQREVSHGDVNVDPGDICDWPAQIGRQQPVPGADVKS